MCKLWRAKHLYILAYISWIIHTVLLFHKRLVNAKIILVWCSDMKKPSLSNINADKNVLFDIASIL